MLQINVQSYQMQNNKWVKGAVHINKTWCDFIVNDTYFMQDIISHSNHPSKCPIKAVSLHICYVFSSVVMFSVLTHLLSCCMLMPSATHVQYHLAGNSYRAEK
jgi:hypothetical protein